MCRSFAQWVEVKVLILSTLLRRIPILSEQFKKFYSETDQNHVLYFKKSISLFGISLNKDETGIAHELKFIEAGSYLRELFLR